MRIQKKWRASLRDIELTPEFLHAFELMEKTNRCIFVTGKAGTGKSTLLRYFRAKTKKNVVVLAPTGIAAINVEGQTIHSFFRLPPKFIQKEDARFLHRNREVVEQLDAVVIDEVSMLRADLLDGIDHALRINRSRPNVPFGGAQLIFFGDLFQLPPVVDNGLIQAFEQRYQSPYFFSADVMKQVELECFELTKVYRQSEASFIELLGKLRGNQWEQSDIDQLNERVVPVDQKSGDDGITLATTNQRASEINQGKLGALHSPAFQYRARITGEFEESAYPNDPILTLKKGAQIMLIKNDIDKRWVNGSIGYVDCLSEHSIQVSVNGKRCDVPRETWEKIRYVYNEETGRIGSKMVGAFEQYPIKLAWAITIHKSQGQTFDNVMIELGGGAFAHGQVYVALSRCTKFSGIRLGRPIGARDLIFDERILEFKKRWKSGTKERGEA